MPSTRRVLIAMLPILTMVSTPAAAQSHRPVVPAEVPPWPVVTSIDPSEGPESGGQQVLIRGANFGNGTYLIVTFGDTRAPDPQYNPDGSVSVLTPPHPAGVVLVRVDTGIPNGSGKSYTYLPDTDEPEAQPPPANPGPAPSVQPPPASRPGA